MIKSFEIGRIGVDDRGVTKNIDKLRGLLRELFQLDQADLDFGIYRIMNQKRHEVERFLDQELLPQVRSAIDSYRSEDSDSPRGNEPRQHLAQNAHSSALENEVFSDLFTFFRRYYKRGDFLSLRRYKDGVYAIPYEGEEVKLYWANHDQYYIKSSEHFSNYAFTVGQYRVRFELVIAHTERDNNKALRGNERRFVLTSTDPVIENDRDLFVRFEYGPDTQKRSQKACNADIASRVFSEAPAVWKEVLGHKAPTRANPERTILEKHLSDFTARNTFDYFVHKDLGGFLRRELDFFIKNEILLLDDIDQNDHLAQIEEKLRKVRVLRVVAHKVIAFLGQLEDFQKKLWLKKKFVVQTNWCISLDRVPEEFYPEIAANDTQCAEWKRLYSIDTIGGDKVTPVYSRPVSLEFLKQNRFLVVNTAHYDPEFEERLLESINDRESFTSYGLAIHADGQQALRLLQGSYAKLIPAIYIDPPYNTGDNEFPYKDGFRHSSWLSLVLSRICSSLPLLNDEGQLLVSCDDAECHRLRLALDEVRGPEFLANLVWKSRQNVDSRSKNNISNDHEFVLAFGKAFRGAEKDLSKYANPDNDARGPWMSDNIVGLATRAQRPNLHYDLFVDAGNITRVDNATLKVVTSALGAFDVSDDTLIGRCPGPGELMAFALSLDKKAVLAFGHVAQPLDGRVVPIGRYYCPDKGWRYEPKSMLGRVVDRRILWPKNAHGRPRKKTYIRELRSDYTGFSSAVGFTSNGTEDLVSLMGKDVPFSFPKPVELMKRLIEQCCPVDGTILDFFAGSGTTAIATMALNRDLDRKRNFIVVEMGEYFDSVLLPRVLKAAYSSEWVAGRPKSQNGIPLYLKVLRLESYEDTLDNLELRKRTQHQQQLLDSSPEAREDYILSYMLDVETKGSASLLNIDQFKDPFNYKLKVTRNHETRVTTVDLIETFNCLIGLRVDSRRARIHRTAEFVRDQYDRLQVQGETKPCAAGEGWTFRVIQGRTRYNERVLIIWRVLTDDSEKDNLMLDTFCKELGLSTGNMEFDVIYVNGDNNLENVQNHKNTWKVQLIEECFHRLMFDIHDV